MKKQDRIVVAYVCDESYIKYLKISMDSVRRYNHNVEFAILTNKRFDIEDIDAQVFTFNPDNYLFKYRKRDRMNEGVYYKFYLPLLPYDKVIYMDCDIICQRPLNALWEEKCDFICATESHDYGKVQAKSLGVSKYALTGMMIMNLRELRQAQFTNKCLLRLNKENPHWHDETIINLEFNDKIRFIDTKYNYCRNRKYEKPIPESDAYLLHYVGDQKADMLLLDNFESLKVLKKLLYNKRVAIVGNAESLLQKEQGPEIDRHDVVIRFNKGFCLGPKTGNKTTLLFLATTLDRYELSRFPVAITIKRSKLCNNDCDFSIRTNDRTSLAQEPTNAVLQKGGGKCQPSTGFVAINFALSTKAKKIDLYGFDFFNTPTYYNQPGYQTLHNGEKEREKVLEYEKCGLLKIN